MMLAYVEFRSTSEMEEILEYKKQEMRETHESISLNTDISSDPDVSGKPLTPVQSRQAAQ